MPATMTHAYFAMDVYDNLPIGLKGLLMDEKKSLRMFGQSMDPLFFYHKISLKNGRKQQEFANYFHTHKSREFFVNLINYIKYNGYYKIPDVMAYLYGFLSHYTLDKTMHPFVYYKTGHFDKQDLSTLKYNGKHHEMEVFLDNYFIKQRENRNPYKFKFHQFCFDFKPFSKELEEVINYSFEETFGVKNMCQFYRQSLKDMYAALKYFRYDKTGLKRNIYSLVDHVKPKNTFPLAVASYHLTLKDDKNYLNLNHSTWNHPCKKKEKHQESAIELYLSALHEASSTIKEVNAYIKGTKKVKLETIFKNCSYSTGIDCDKSQTMKYFEN